MIIALFGNRFMSRRWRKVVASEMCSLSQQVQQSEGSRWPGGTWTSAAGSANMEVSSAGKAIESLS